MPNEIQKPVKRATDTEPGAVATGSLVQLAAAGENKSTDHVSQKIELLTSLLPQAVPHRSIVREADIRK